MKTTSVNLSRALAGTALAALAAGVGGCGGTDGSGTPGTAPVPSASAAAAGPTTSAAAPASGPDVAARCAEAERIIVRSTDAFTVQLAATVSAGEAGRTADRDRHLAQLKAVLADWARQLDAVGARTSTPRLQGVLVEYAGAVRAALARVHGPDDLERLSTFDDLELDTAADLLARTC